MVAGKVVLITGGASGMGAASATLFAERGAAVVIADLDRARAADITQQLDLGDAITGDVADPAFCASAVAEVLDRHGRLDILVNAAGIIHRADAPSTSDDDWQRMLDVNVSGVFYMSRAAIAPMRAQGGGVIVNFGSIWGGVGAEGVVAYCAAKGAVHQLTRAMALDHAGENIRINAVCPGEIDTPMLASGRERAPSPEDLQELADRTIPMKRLGKPGEVAKMVVFLASDDASYMTGALVPVDAGYTAR